MMKIYFGDAKSFTIVGLQVATTYLIQVVTTTDGTPGLPAYINATTQPAGIQLDYYIHLYSP